MVNLKRFLEKHSKTGYIIISAGKSYFDNKSNNIRYNNLIKDIISNSYSYIPCFGGYCENNNLNPTFEKSVFITNYDCFGNIKKIQDLFNLALYLCNKYDQECAFIKIPNSKSIYIDENGNIINTFNNIIYNDLSQKYFTSFIKSKNIDKNQNNRKISRFTFIN